MPLKHVPIVGNVPEMMFSGIFGYPAFSEVTVPPRPETPDAGCFPAIGKVLFPCHMLRFRMRVPPRTITPGNICFPTQIISIQQ